MTRQERYFEVRAVEFGTWFSEDTEKVKNSKMVLSSVSGLRKWVEIKSFVWDREC